uniref:Pimeloyl-[acyl-carrier protein] methyl ester esterase n=1 Tax=Candidatus Kentrum sp. MB TaxID=2138164 RepID=A0A450XPC3_9GAMM|nr:MAG: pimeloyl-[acyl-carrier protein] methyl ester esterase [Candidatus Kentron sp. MB]VFK31172.1 MAG: pimeloyl-[acyl-carrier protein] methyl ester esterase [Candidatus Kentron sp. MB]VFK75377.1 MAG: pimeloyl-[acyl-carrier protein] methyl ester esterase [Candidatus Kentron sp. MB]
MNHLPKSVPAKPLLAIHGWGFNSAVWDDIGNQLKTDYRFNAIDLPGFGQSPMLEGEYTLSALADSVADSMDEARVDSMNETMAITAPSSSVIMGWSLGGLVALEMAHRYPERVRALVMVASGPRFTTTADWPHGVAPNILDTFSETLAQDHKTALSRFLLLQAGRTDAGRATVKKLKSLLFRHGGPDRRALKEGLTLLRETDARQILGMIRCPVLFILGGKDNLLSSSVATDLPRLCPGCQVLVIEGSAHAPFISHPVEFLQGLLSFLNVHEEEFHHPGK